MSEEKKAEKEKKLPELDHKGEAEIEFRIPGAKPVIVTLSSGRAKVLCRNTAKRYEWKYGE